MDQRRRTVAHPVWNWIKISILLNIAFKGMFVCAIPQQIFIPGLNIESQPQAQPQQQQKINSFEIPSTNGVNQKPGVQQNINNIFPYYTNSVQKQSQQPLQYATNKQQQYIPTNYIQNSNNYPNYNVQTTKTFSAPVAIPLNNNNNKDVIITEISSPSAAAAIAASLAKLKQQQQQAAQTNYLNSLNNNNTAPKLQPQQPQQQKSLPVYQNFNSALNNIKPYEAQPQPQPQQPIQQFPFGNNFASSNNNNNVNKINYANGNNNYAAQNVNTNSFAAAAVNNNLNKNFNYNYNPAPSNVNTNNVRKNLQETVLDDIECAQVSNKKQADRKFCNMYHSCSNGNYQVLLCPESYLYSEETQQCEVKRKVECGKRMAVEYDHTNVPYVEPYSGSYTLINPKIVNGSLECPLGSDGYYADPEFCNIYHHCLAGVDYADQCPHQLVWNDRKKMCDWQTNVNCTGKIIPVAYGQTSFCTDKSDNKYKDPEFCNVFHHCVGGIDNLVRCDGELQWNEKESKCDWESKVKCDGKMLPSEKHYNSTFCIGKTDGPYAHEEYCNVYHVCESGSDNIRQCPNQLFWDSSSKRCDWSGKVECTGRTLVTLSTDTTLFCMERKDGVYGDPVWCNVYHNCLSGVDFRTKCPDNLVWNDTKKDCDWSDSTQCGTGNLFKDGSDINQKTFCSDKPNGKYPHDLHCNRYYVCQNGKDIVFTCQNNLRYNEAKQECDWAVNVECGGKADYMWEGIKDNFCKNRPDGNYPDNFYCNIFHQCQAAMDYPKRCSNRLMFNVEKGECDWEDQVDCRGKEKLIETSGLEDESRPDQQSSDGKGRVTKFCMLKENGNYADVYYCNVYHNCHGGFDTVQYCSNGLVWRQDTSTSGTCDWPLSSKVANGVDCGNKQLFFIDKQSQVDIMASLRSDFCITTGEGLFPHTKYCDLYIHCTAQAVAITQECSPGLIFNEKKKECDYVADELNFINSTYCPAPKQILRPKPKADGTLMFNGNDVTGKFPTKFTCEEKSQQSMLADDDWCNIYHVCAGPRDNIFICPPGTVFNNQKQGCYDRYTSQTCGGANYYKPNIKKLVNNFFPNTNTNFDLY